MNASSAFEAAAPRAVDVAAVERELARMWATSTSGADPGVVRAALCNLIVLSGRDEAEASAAIAGIAAAVPHRALVVADAAAASGVEAWISAHCRRTGSGAQVCCEQVTVRAARTAAARVASTLLALLVPDLPVVCWLRCMTDFDDPLLDRLGRHLDRLLVDCEAADGAAFRSLETWRRAHPQVAVADLAWERLAIWRELVAGSFDGEPFEALLANVSQVRLVYGAPAQGGAALLLGWLASRLGWRALSAAAALDAAGNPIAIAGVVETAAHDLRSIVITMRDGSRCEVRHDAAGSLIAKLEHAAACALPRVLKARADDDAAWVVRLLQRPARNPAYAAALAAAAQRAAGAG